MDQEALSHWDGGSWLEEWSTNSWTWKCVGSAVPASSLQIYWAYRIHPRVFKDLADVTTKALSTIFERTWKSGRGPSWQEAIECTIQQLIGVIGLNQMLPSLHEEEEKFLPEDTLQTGQFLYFQAMEGTLWLPAIRMQSLSHFMVLTGTPAHGSSCKKSFGFRHLGNCCLHDLKNLWVFSSLFSFHPCKDLLLKYSATSFKRQQKDVSIGANLGENSSHGKELSKATAWQAGACCCLKKFACFLSQQMK